MSVFEDLEAEEDRLETILEDLTDEAWHHESAAAGWCVTDVVLHLAQSEEIVVSSSRSGGSSLRVDDDARELDAIMDSMVRAERSSPKAAFDRWRKARREALQILRQADPHTTIPWATNPLRPATLATTRLAEHWAHGIDITTPLGIAFEDTDRLRHIAWLAHRSLPYSFALAGQEPVEVHCQLSSHRGETWEFGSREALSWITGPAGDFCRVGAQRMAVGASRLVASGPHGHLALQFLRNYAA